MSAFLDILWRVLCCVQDEGENEDFYSPYRESLFERRNNSSNHLINIESTYPKFVSIFRSKRTEKLSVPSYNTPTYYSRLPNPSSIPSPSRSKPQTSPSRSVEPFRAHPTPLFKSLSPSTSAPKLQTCVPKPSPSFPIHTTPSLKSLNPSPSAPKPQTYISKPSPMLVSSSSKQTPVSPVVPKPTALFPSPVSSSSKVTPVSPLVPPTFKPILAPVPANSTDQKNSSSYILNEKDRLPIYAIPKGIKDLIKKDIVPDVLKKPLTLSTYKDYFGALLYAEDFYIEKWSEFKLENVTLKLKQVAVFKQSPSRDTRVKEEKTFVSFDIDSCLENRPFLLSRDFVFVRPSGRTSRAYQGVLNRVERSTNVLVEFGGDFHSQHLPSRKYDVSFSLNRVCLKRAHQGILAASYPLFGIFTFPDCEFWKQIDTLLPPYSSYELNMNQISAVRRILTHQRPPPYLIKGPLCVPKRRERNSPPKCLSVTGEVIQHAVLEIYQTLKTNRVLICAPINNTCDNLMRSLKGIPESDVFRANAAFREIYEVDSDILVSSLYKDDCFACPPLEKLKKFRVILSTYASSFRLHNVGLTAGHFSHIFMVDASSATEPEVMVALANFGNENTAVIVTGAPNNRSGWVRSNLARQNGLMISYFERLCQRNPYKSLDPNFITRLVASDSKNNISCTSLIWT
ncbi:P-loop containing nucleoside triphosphate hydrolases superfamily protein [Euphorbia peplus]|nr:P-loop containing nucleoside triphosphate hydrolases superfamily protein [Euphorbia peplus]